MYFLKSILALSLCMYIVNCPAQEKNYELSKPVDLAKTGVNKVLVMGNGNTMLFHFEPSSGITIKVFDKERKEIASRKENCHYLDVYVIQTARFKGLFEIGGEAVLFFDQESKFNRHRLIRLCFNATTGALMSEAVVAESANKNKQIRFYVMKNKDKDNYAILFSMSTNYPRRADVYVQYFNSRHEVEKKVQLDVDRNKYDYMDVTGATYLGTGVVVTLGLSKVLQNGTISHGNAYDPAGNTFGPFVSINQVATSNPSAFTNTSSGGRPLLSDPLGFGSNYDEFDPTATIYDHFLAIYYIPESSDAAQKRMVNASPDIYPYHTFLTCNPFSNTINLLLFGYKDAYVMYGLERLPAAVMNNVLVRLDEQGPGVKFSHISNRMANDYLKREKDTNSYFLGAPLAMFTGASGTSGMVSEAFTRYANTETPDRPRLFETYLGNIAVTRFDGDGNELFGVVLPRAQYYKSYQHYYYANQLPAKWNDQIMFGDLPEQVYNRQFISLNTYAIGNSIYVLFNDDDKNFNKGIAQKRDTVFSFDRTNTCCYRISDKNEVTKHYLYGVPPKGTYTCSFLEGACFDEKSSVYAALVQYKKRDKVELRMAWSHLDAI